MHIHETVSEAGRLSIYEGYVNGHCQTDASYERRWPKPRIFILAGIKMLT
jgi:hypothetical protein